MVTEILSQLGVPRNNLGFKYIREAILLSVNDSSYINNITRTLYPSIAVKFNSFTNRVERAIRHGIEIVNNKTEQNGNELFEKLFPVNYNTYKKPTNGEFIATIADYLRLNAKKEAI